MTRLPIALALLTVAVTGHAQIHRCEMNGQTVYQQSPCPAGESTRLEVQQVPVGSADGWLRALEMQPLSDLEKGKLPRRVSGRLVRLPESDAHHITRTYEQMLAAREGGDSDGAEIHRGFLVRLLRRYDLTLEEVEPLRSSGKRIATRVDEVIVRRQLDPASQAFLQREQERQRSVQRLQDAERERREAVLRARREEAAQQAEQEAGESRDPPGDPVLTADGRLLHPEGADGVTFRDDAGVIFIREGDSVFNTRNGERVQLP